MRAAILAVGSELLSTDRVDTNSLRLAESLERHGVDLIGKQVIGDDRERIAAALKELAGDVELALVTGGLGPTSDDVTRSATADALELELQIDPEIVADIRRKFASFGREMPPSNECQAEVPQGARVIDNPRGTAPGLILERDGTTFFLFPGVPRELEGMILSALDPWLEAHSGSAADHRLTLRVACMPESEVEDRLAPAYEAFRAPGFEGLGEVGLLASPGDIRVRLQGSTPSAVARAAELVKDLLGLAVYGEGNEQLEAVVGRGLRDAGLTLATAESCTGGWIAQRLTAVPGSSEYFLGGIVAYADRVKTGQLGVAEELIARHGAVSEEVVREMAQGARRRLGSDWAVAVSGVAGPGGGSPEKPVGTVEVALAQGDSETLHRRLNLPGDRRTIRLLTTQWTLDLVRLELAAAREAEE